MQSSPRFMQGVFAFEGKGIESPFPLSPALSYTVPAGTTTQTVYFRGGNTTGELIYVLLVRDGTPMRYFPIGAKNHVHGPLRVVGDLDGGTGIGLFLPAPEGGAGAVGVDMTWVDGR